MFGNQQGFRKHYKSGGGHMDRRGTLSEFLEMRLSTFSGGKTLK